LRDEHFCTVSYSSFDKAIDMISFLGHWAQLGKIDIRQVFSLLIVNPANFDLLGIMFDGNYYVDKCLPMDCFISCDLFEKFVTLLHWVIEHKSGISTLDHYLDDVLFARAALSNDCKILMDTFHSVSHDLDMHFAENKTEGPTTHWTYLGLNIGTVAMKFKISAYLLDQNKQIMSYEIIQDTYHVDTTFVVFYGIFKCNTKTLEALDQYMA